ncbi:MAG: FtsX-like permease family protein, partial [Gemmatimonadaceae bacterium]
VLVAAQTALALILLAGAGLMLQSVRNLRNVSPGFDSTGVLTAVVNLPHARYKSFEQVDAFYHELLARASVIPGVQAVGAGADIPLNGFGGCAAVWREDHPLQPGEEPPCVGASTAAPGYFHALGIKVRGQEPSWSDMERLSGGVVVTRALAERLWPGKDAMGKGIRGNVDGPPYYHVVGVTDDIRGVALDQPPVETVFFPMLPTAELWSPPTTMTLILKSRGVAPEALTGSLRHLLRGMDPNVPLAKVQTMDAVAAKSMRRLSFTMMLLGIAATMALILSAVGIYGVISYIVGRRTGEIGIRMALGARASRVGRLIVWQSLRLTGIGVVIGILGALAMTRVLRSVLFDVSPTDPFTLASVSAVMLIIAGLASYVPAQRAMRVEPAEALRAE